MGGKFVNVLSETHAVKFLLHRIEGTAAPPSFRHRRGSQPFLGQSDAETGDSLFLGSVWCKFLVPSGFPGVGVE